MNSLWSTPTGGIADFCLPSRQQDNPVQARKVYGAYPYFSFQEKK